MDNDVESQEFLSLKTPLVTAASVESTGAVPVVRKSRCPFNRLQCDASWKPYYVIASFAVMYGIMKLSVTYPLCAGGVVSLDSTYCQDRFWNRWVNLDGHLFDYFAWIAYLSFFWICLAPVAISSEESAAGDESTCLQRCLQYLSWLVSFIVLLAFVAIVTSWLISMATFGCMLVYQSRERGKHGHISLAPYHLLWSWSIVLAIIIYRERQTKLLLKIYKDFKNKDVDVIPQSKCTLFVYWVFWSMGLVASASILAADLPRLRASFPDTDTSILLRTLFCALVVCRKISKMNAQTIIGNDSAVESSGLNDDIWAFYARPCVLSQWVMLWSISWTVWDESDHLPPELISHYLLAALIIMCTTFAWMVGSAFAYRGSLHIHKVFWVVRRSGKRGNDPVDTRFLQVYVNWVAPNNLWDRFGLDERMARRLSDHCCLEWAASKGFTYFTIPQIMLEERNFIRQPAVNDIDSYTKLMLWAIKVMTVEAGRLDPLFMNSDTIKLPFKKQHIDTIRTGIAGLEMATWDEQYSDRTLKKTESSSTFTMLLQILHWAFPAVTDPRWFIHELEGVLTYEAVVAPFAATCNTHWSDFTTDEAIEMMAFYGIMQFLLEGKESHAFKQTCETEPFNHISAPKPEDIQVLIDYNWISNYSVRERHARYGFIACFASGRSQRTCQLSHIYVSHWDQWVSRPRDNAPKDDINKKRWEHAKFVIKASIGAGVTLNEHLLQCHWIVSNAASLAARTCLDRYHPIRRFLHTFVLRAASINYASTLTLLPEDRFVHRASGLEYEAMAGIFNDCARKFRFETFPDIVKSKRLGGLEAQLPWAQDGMKYWNVVHRFVSVYVNIFYDRDEAVAQDKELQAFWAMVNGIPAGPDGYDAGGPDFGYKLPHLRLEKTNTGPCAKDCKHRLIDYLTHVIFNVTANHEYFGALAEYFTSPMGLSTKLWDETCEENGLDQCGQVMADIQTYMQDLCIVSGTGYPQPQLMSQWDFMMHFPERGATEYQDLCLNQEQIKKAKEYLDILNQHRDSTYDVDPDLTMSYNLRDTIDVDMPKKPFNSKDRSVVVDEVVKEKLTREDQNAMLTQIHAAFMEELWRLNCEIEDQNEKRKRPFEAFKPKNLECSVNI